MENQDEKKSKSQLKREAEELQKLGESLVKLSLPQLKGMGLPDKLINALIDAKSITSHIAGRRQRQYIGTLMRDMDPTPIRQALETIESGVLIDSSLEKETTVWQERLLSGEPDSTQSFLLSNRDLSRQEFRQLLRNVNREKTKNKSIKVLRKLIQHHLNNNR